MEQREIGESAMVIAGSKGIKGSISSFSKNRLDQKIFNTLWDGQDR
jgi:hypothetical protein